MENDQREMLRESLDKLDMTQEEVNRFEKAFKDPKFKEMFEDYAKEISDPKARAESEAYLRQIESGNQTESMYGSDVQLIVPEEAFVVKTRREDGDGEKVFINVCTSEKIEEAQSKKTVRDGKEGQTWQIPFSLGKERDTENKSGNAAKVIDFVLHPKTCERCDFLPFKDMVAQTAIENIEIARGMKLNKTVVYLKMKYKGSEGMDRPGVQSVRISAANQQNGEINPLKAPQTTKASGDKDDKSPPNSTRSGFSFDRAVNRKKAAKAAVPKEGEPGFVYASGQQVPPFSIVEKGEYDIANTWGDMGKALDNAPKRPKELTLKVTLAGVRGVGEISLDVTSAEVLLSVSTKYKLEAKLPYPVFDKKGKAKFDKKKQTLEITLPVVPPEKPKSKPFVEPVKLVEEIESNEGTQGEEALAEKKEEKEEAARTEAAAGEASPSPQKEESEPQGESENERKWKAMHVASQKAAEEEEKSKLASKSEPEETAAPREDPGSGEDFRKRFQESIERKDDFIPCDTFSGKVEGYLFKSDKKGLGYYRDQTSAESKSAKEEPEKAKETKNKFVVLPSPSAPLWDELD